jgi:hypothetical protein
MRVENAGNAGFCCVRDFMRSDEQEGIVTLAAADRRDADEYECQRRSKTYASFAMSPARANQGCNALTIIEVSWLHVTERSLVSVQL